MYAENGRQYMQEEYFAKCQMGKSFCFRAPLEISPTLSSRFSLLLFFIKKMPGMHSWIRNESTFYIRLVLKKTPMIEYKIPL